MHIRAQEAAAPQSERRTLERLLARGAVIALLGGIVLYGWRELWFLTDDSYISFRYIDHARRGWGYTWNPPPFRPVEGYSNFLWVVLLHGIWVVTGYEPPQAANPVSLFFAYGTLALAFATTVRCAWSPALRPHRFWVAVSVVAFAATHRTFLTWTSSGLETSLYMFCTMLWLFGTLEVMRRGTVMGLVCACSGGALSALTRPDGLLFFAASLLPLAIQLRRRPWSWRRLWCGLPLLLVPSHLLWRHATYGAWVPNTFHAKQVSIWPAAGLRYAGSFLLEHAIWVWAVLAAVLLFRKLAVIERVGLAPGALVPWSGPALVLTVLLAHAAYFVFAVGGDHFEYRVFAHAVLPLGIALIYMLDRLGWGTRATFGLFIAVAAIGQVLPWVHYHRSQHLLQRHETIKLFVPTADAFPPGPWRSYAKMFDRLQAWMIPRHVGTRHQEHKIFTQSDLEPYFLPMRERESIIPWSARGVMEMNAVGVVGWALPEVAILDRHGLNDAVVARNPVDAGRDRVMAHERHPPPGYIECFAPNMFLTLGRAVVTPRPEPLTDARIRECERNFANIVGAAQPSE